MRVDSLDELKSAFAKWRRSKKHAREPMPEQLLARARRATNEHGVTAVVRVTRVERARLFRSRPARSKAQGATRKKAQGVRRSVPTFSRLELSAPSAPGPRALAEVETGSGVTLRVFEPTPEMMGVLTAMCGCGGVR
jgi:hypothetical protein